MKTIWIAVLLGAAVQAVGNAQDAAGIDTAGTGARSRAAPPAGSRAAGGWIADINLTAATGDTQCLGVEFDETDWWITGAFDKLACKLYQVGKGGMLRNVFEQHNSGWGWRDLAWDGAFLYASDSFVIEQIDPATGAATGVVIPSPISPARALAYDSATDSFWTSSFGSSIYNVQRDGTFAIFPNPAALETYGMAMDEINDILWIWSQTGGCRADAFDPRTGTFTGESFDGNAGAAGTAGGCCIFDDRNHGLVFAGLKQGTPDDYITVFDLGVDPAPQLDIQCNGQDAGVVVPRFQNAALTISVQARHGAGVPVDLWCIIKKDGGSFYTYDGAWHAGLKHPAYTGGLIDIESRTILDRTISLGSYTAYIALDTNADGAFDPGDVAKMDAVDFTVEALQGFVEDFEDGQAQGWIPDGPHWTAAGGVYRLDTPSFANWISHYSLFDYSDFTYSADMRMIDTGHTSGNYYYGIFFRSDGTLNNGYSLHAGYNGSVVLQKISGGAAVTLASGSPPGFVTGAGNWNNLAVHASGPTIQVLINGALVFAVSDSAHSSGKVGLRGQGSGSFDHDYEFDNVAVTL